MLPVVLCEIPSSQLDADRTRCDAGGKEKKAANDFIDVPIEEVNNRISQTIIVDCNNVRGTYTDRNGPARFEMFVCIPMGAFFPHRRS